MPRNHSKREKTVKGHHTKARQSVKAQHQADGGAVPKQAGTAAVMRTGRLAKDLVTELARPIVGSSGVPASYVAAANGTGLFGTAARIAGGALAMGSIVIVAPIIFFVEALTIGRDRKIGRSARYEVDELGSREYRDKMGQTHHHTRTFMRDHAGELRTLAA